MLPGERERRPPQTATATKPVRGIAVAPFAELTFRRFYRL
jgi:hypothetical protein